MSRELYIELTKNFCKLANLDHPERLLEGRAVEIDGIDFYLAYREETEPDILMIYCDFGIPPKDRLVDAYKALLDANLSIYGSYSPAFMLSPTKNVALGCHYRLEHVTSAQLMTLLITLAAQAKEWREHYFLEPASPSGV